MIWAHAIWVSLWLCAARVVVRAVRNGALHHRPDNIPLEATLMTSDGQTIKLDARGPGMRRCSGRSRRPDQRSRITERRDRLVLFVEPDEWLARE